MMDAGGHAFDFISSHAAIVIYSDPILLRHIVLNLLTNAVKYSPDKTKITVELTLHEDNIVVSVKDNGKGISEKDKARLFEAFFRSSENIGLISGTGFGLVITKNCVETLQGEISVQSEINKGSTFTVRLPKDF